ncbi:MAG: (Fe-S)-binding protein [Anaerolineales bacterium]|nr:(Fe-S)-binding protein [Anaerolineales bacterium]
MTDHGETLIDTYDLEIFTPPCEPGAERYSAIAHLVGDISQVLPYLNAELSGAVYRSAANVLTWKKAGRNIAFHADKVCVSNVEDRANAEKELKRLINLVNRTWKRRAEITPDTTSRQRPAPMAVYKLLPGTNCKQCGEATCWVYAFKLAASQKNLSDCPPLHESQHADKLQALEEIIIESPAIN